MNASTSNPAKRALDGNDTDPRAADHQESSDQPTITLLSRLAPTFLPATTRSDPSVDPATLAIPQWSGPCSLTLSPVVPHLPLTGGELTVANTRVYYWHAGKQVGFALDYRAVVMHAVASASDQDAGNSKSVYCQLAVDVKREIARGVAAVVVGAEAALGVDVNGTAQDGDEDEDDEAFSELTIVPVDNTQVDDLFSAMSMCASMHPDPAGQDEDGEEDDMDVDMMMAMMAGGGTHAMDMDLSEQGQANLARFETMLENATANGDHAGGEEGQFDDADGEQERRR
ncbi:regulator of volume decrease after cellular swelling-domain-containing protein [Catenaria anguillulae PL171]|uniref:Regulator of volume decrease after cellular swelling-domain-containing protein n=1 Tax=Catenaria anguillulae PL171 TaxID=765915 RepID=A0A1Y2HVP0_9FUNG|nr:regulator of volume decrease after cellular swelling-domain-containing protein [Catenaria anguillulae PL171]